MAWHDTGFCTWRLNPFLRHKDTVTLEIRLHDASKYASQANSRWACQVIGKSANEDSSEQTDQNTICSIDSLTRDPRAYYKLSAAAAKTLQRFGGTKSPLAITTSSEPD